MSSRTAPAPSQTISAVTRDPLVGQRVLWLVALLLVVTIVGRFLAEPIRRAIFVETPRRVPVAPVEASGATAAADSFFVRRDQVVYVVPRDITVGEFLDLNHLRNTRGIRDELRAGAGVFEDPQILRTGKTLRFHLTVPAR
ncbi:MAG TPA: hypothetical protein VFS20_11530 [Longimicrobium sp.]|nr:hypothetical protein [Longimicrobium sp.]